MLLTFHTWDAKLSANRGRCDYLEQEPKTGASSARVTFGEQFPMGGSLITLLPEAQGWWAWI